MVEQNIEAKVDASFIEKTTSEDEEARCVDGRPSKKSKQGFQMLGASVHPMAIKMLYSGSQLDHSTVSSMLNTLQNQGFKTGAHRGEHSNDEESDCGFADRLPEIVKTAQEHEGTITERLTRAYEANRALFDRFAHKPFPALVAHAYQKIRDFDTNNIKLTGEALVKQIESSRSTVEQVEGDHKEEVAFVNLKKGSTLDTRQLNQQGAQGFNLDLIPAVQQSAALGVQDEFAIPASLILYQATEMVLVEAKGKPPLPVMVNS